MTMDVKTVDLSSLNEFMNEILESTEYVRKKIQEEYDEANSVLRPWIIETLVSREVEADFCTCQPKNNLEDQAEEIASGIDKALTQAQELRKVLARNIKEEKIRFSKPNVQQIYGPKLDSKSKSQNVVVRNGKISQDHPKPESSEPKKTLLPRFQKAKPKNFIAANKSSIKAMSQKNSKINTESKSSSDSNGFLRTKNTFPSVTELDNLIKKVSFDTEENASSPGLNDLKNDCPRHGENVARIVTEKKRIIINLVEGLERFGVPEDLLKILKLYNSFIVKKPKETIRKGIKTFFENLNSFHEEQLSEIPEKNLVHLVRNFNKLHRDLHQNFTDMSQIHSFKNSYYEMDNLSKTCNIKKYDSLKTRRRDLKEYRTRNIVTSGWLSNGIWNSSTFDHFSAFPKCVSVIRYSNKNQLLSFFNTTQHIQQIVYQKNLLDIILEKIIPEIKNIDPNSREYIALYKMVFTIAQVLNPKMPVLVKTNS